MMIARRLPPVAGIGVLSLWLLSFLRPHNPGLGEFRTPALALELVSGAQELERVVKAYPKEAISGALWFDSLLIIPIYCVLYICLGISLIKLPNRYAVATGRLMAVCVLPAAAADYVENYYSWQAITIQTQQVADAIRWAALTKWWLLVVITALLAGIFLHFGGKSQRVAALYLIAAVVGAAGLLQHYPLVEWFFALLALALIPTGAVLKTYSPGVS